MYQAAAQTDSAKATADEKKLVNVVDKKRHEVYKKRCFKTVSTLSTFKDAKRLKSEPQASVNESSNRLKELPTRNQRLESDGKKIKREDHDVDNTQLLFKQQSSQSGDVVNSRLKSFITVRLIKIHYFLI